MLFSYILKKALLLSLASTFSLLLMGQTLAIDHAKTLVDKKTGICYASVKASSDDSLRVLFSYQTSPEDSPEKVCIDGKEFDNNTQLTVLANKSMHQLVAETNVRKDTLYFVLSTLPLVTINRVNEQSFVKDAPILTRFAIYDAQARIDGTNYFTSKANTCYRGATASQMDKKSFKVELVEDGDVNEERDVNLFGIRETDTWILDAAAIDYSRMRNRVSTDIWNNMSTLRDGDMMRNGTKGVFVELMVDSTYQGLYCFTDNINRSLLGIKKVKEEADFDNTVRGILYKCKGNGFGTSYLTKPQEDWWLPNTERWFDWFLKYPKDIFDDRCWQPLYDLIDKTDINSANPDSVKAVTDCFYYKNLVEYAVFGMSMRLVDNFMHNTYLSVKNSNNSFQLWITPWDMDGSFGRDGAATIYNTPAQADYVFYKCHPFLYYFNEQVQPFFNDFCELSQQLHAKGQPLSADVVSQLIDSYVSAIEASGSWQREYERWSGMNNILLNTPINLGASLKEEATFMKEWYKMNEENLCSFYLPMAISNTANKVARSHSIYLLNGTKLNTTSTEHLPHGIYIIDGKKIIK